MKPNGHDESIAVKVEDGFVILATPHGYVKLDPQTGYEFGEAVARAAHEAKFGEAPDDEQYLASQVRARTTEQMRGKMVNKFALMIPSLLEQGKDPAFMAQIEAALFAFRSPLSKGALLADEVGLGKTIEAGLVLSQKWAERKRRILVITPSNLRKQWHQELLEKFFLPCCILEMKSYNDTVRQGHVRPFECDDIIICSYQFARTKAAEISLMRWDLVVDEAHRLRNVYKPTNVIANTIKHALKDAPKLLLTATPLQDSLLELYGLPSACRLASARFFAPCPRARPIARSRRIWACGPLRFAPTWSTCGPSSA